MFLTNNCSPSSETYKYVSSRWWSQPRSLLCATTVVGCLSLSGPPGLGLGDLGLPGRQPRSLVCQAWAQTRSGRVKKPLFGRFWEGLARSRKTPYFRAPSQDPPTLIKDRFSSLFGQKRIAEDGLSTENHDFHPPRGRKNDPKMTPFWPYFRPSREGPGAPKTPFFGRFRGLAGSRGQTWLPGRPPGPRRRPGVEPGRPGRPWDAAMTHPWRQ